MKKLLSIFLLLIIVISTTACSSSDSDGVKKIFNSMEYAMYMNIFAENGGDKFVDKDLEKEGIFTVLYDSYNDTTRYYVWGYSDETLCCDWQWEFVPKDTENLPKIGSHVKVSGTFVQNSNALDGYWLENASVETKTEYNNASGDYDMTTLSPTLTRVQVSNMVNHASQYDGKTVKIYGRVMSGNKIQHPYYDNSWSLALEYSGKLPPIGSWVTVTGTFSQSFSMTSSESECKIIVESLEVDK